MPFRHTIIAMKYYVNDTSVEMKPYTFCVLNELLYILHKYCTFLQITHCEEWRNPAEKVTLVRVWAPCCRQDDPLFSSSHKQTGVCLYITYTHKIVYLYTYMYVCMYIYM